MGRPPRVVVVGAGPAGAAVAAELARDGARVLSLHRPSARAHLPESLPPSAARVFDRLGLALEARWHARCPAFVSRWGGVEVCEDFVRAAEGEAWIIDRAPFDDALRELAARRGARSIVVDELLGVERSGGGWRVAIRTGARRVVFADALVDASGRSRVLARRLGIPVRRGARLVASWGQTRLADRDERVHVMDDRDGWWLRVGAPQRPRVAIAHFAPRALTSVALSNLAPPEFGRVRVPRVHVAPAHDSRLARFAGPGWLAVGDAAMTFDPLASHGLVSALGGAIYAAIAIRAAVTGELTALDSYRLLLEERWCAYRSTLAARYAYSRFRER